MTIRVGLGIITGNFIPDAEINIAHDITGAPRFGRDRRMWGATANDTGLTVVVWSAVSVGAERLALRGVV